MLFFKEPSGKSAHVNASLYLQKLLGDPSKVETKFLLFIDWQFIDRNFSPSLLSGVTSYCSDVI